jgi:hypothetical protein
VSDIFRDVPAFIYLGSIHADPEVGGRVPFICTTGGKERYNSLGVAEDGRETVNDYTFRFSQKGKKKKQTKSIEKWQNKSNIFIPFFLFFFLSTKTHKQNKIKLA